MLPRIGLISASGTRGVAALSLARLCAGALFGASSRRGGFFVDAAHPSLSLSLSAGVVTEYVAPRFVDHCGDRLWPATLWAAMGGVS